MAKTSMIEKNKKRMKRVEEFKARRVELKKKARDLELSPDERWEAQIALEKQPRDASPARVRTRCLLTGRPRGVYRKFKLSRLALRQLALEGKLPGMTKASW